MLQRIRRNRGLLWATILLLLLSCRQDFGCHAQAADDAASTNNSDEDLIRIIVRLKSKEDQESFWDSMAPNNNVDRSSSSSLSDRPWFFHHPRRQRVYRYQRSHAIAMTIPASDLEEFQRNHTSDPRVSSITKDTKMRLFSNEASKTEILPYGIEAIQGTSPVIPKPFYTDSSSCADPNSFKVCVVDSGLLVAHPDIPYSQTDDASIRGSTFGLPDTAQWYNPTPASAHGTHVTGTILALANNGVGVVGVLPDAHAQGICLLIARTFDDQGIQDASFISQAVEWCADQGARVINMSLGSTETLEQVDRDVYINLWDKEGVLMVAAAGNEGTDQFAFPASLDSVMSVAATTESLDQRANFSQYNSQVDIAAPGVNVLSTITTNALRLTSLQILVDAALMQYSLDAPASLLQSQLSLVNCELGFNACQDAVGKACIIERGITFFWEKALNCQRGQGVAAFIFNNEDEMYGGSLTEDRKGVDIPTFAISREDGLLLLDVIASTTATLQPASPSYGFLDGTSMATPHVAGAAVKIWAARPACTNWQIREALSLSARDLGQPGRDDEFGYGLVQAEAAFEYIVNNFDPPCGGPSAVLEENGGSAGQNCVANFASCTSNAECCSGRCLGVSEDGTRNCRPIPTVQKNKVGGTRGGAAAAAGGRKRLLGRQIRGRNDQQVELQQQQEED